MAVRVVAVAHETCCLGLCVGDQRAAKGFVPNIDIGRIIVSPLGAMALEAC